MRRGHPPTPPPEGSRWDGHCRVGRLILAAPSTQRLPCLQSLGRSRDVTSAHLVCPGEESAESWSIMCPMAVIAQGMEHRAPVPGPWSSHAHSAKGGPQPWGWSNSGSRKHDPGHPGKRALHGTGQSNPMGNPSQWQGCRQAHGPTARAAKATRGSKAMGAEHGVGDGWQAVPWKGMNH